MSETDTKAKDLFLQALDLQPEQIAGFLENACGGDAELRQRVQNLLDAHNEAGEFLAPSALKETDIRNPPEPDLDGFPETTASMTTKPGTSIGPYKLLEQIGEGGMGSVWVASQSEPIKRRVAIKLIKAGMDTGQVLARFEAERQALAMMDHPNIARVLDGGMTEQGRPYFAMEYVKGVPLTEYCDNAKLSLKDRLELFVPVCQAVQHAHQKGIIHRDLKPSNILVCLYDGKPVPKVIDFGLAKAMHQSLTDQSIYTAHGMMVGTPLYMSPEQAEQNNLDIDTRTDVYALGVILYELLTGTTPLEKAQMKQAAYNEVLRLIKEVEPPKPSMRLSGSASLPSVAAQRGIEPAQLTRSITGDLDWVVMKSLEKERSRRYETANGLAEDIRRHLADEPVSASPPSTSYRVKKFIRRNRAGVIAASAIAITLLLGVAGTTGGMFWALEERKDAVAAREGESEAKRKAVENAKQAEAEALRATAAEAKTAESLKEAEAERDAKERALKEAEQISEFLTNVFQSPDPTRDGREIQVVELLDNAAKKLEIDLADQPAQRAKLQATLGRTYFVLGLYQRAIPVQEQVRDHHLATSGLEHAKVLAAITALANTYHEAGRRDDAMKLREEVLELARKVDGPKHRNTLAMTGNLSIAYFAAGRRNEAVKMLEESTELFREVMGPEHPDTLTAMIHLANFYHRTRRTDEALKLREKLSELLRKANGPEHPNTLHVMAGLAASYFYANRRDEALKLREELLELFRKVMGPEHSDTLSVMHHLADSYYEASRRDEALELREEVLTLRRKTLGPEHPSTLGTMTKLAESYFATGRRDEALKLMEEALRLERKALGSEHPITVGVIEKLADFYYEAGRKDDALELREELLPLRRKVNGPEDPSTLNAMNNLAISYSNAGRSDEALKLRKKMLELSRKAMGQDHPYTLKGMHNLANTYSRVGRTDEALKMREESLELFKTVVGPEAPDTLSAMRSLGGSYSATGRRDGLLKLIEEAQTLERKGLGAEQSQILKTLQSLTSKALTVTARQVWESESEEHASFVRRLLELVSESESPAVLEMTARSASLAPNMDPATYQNAVQLARKALEFGKGVKGFPPWGRMALGMALYRAGSFAEAEKVLAEEKSNAAVVGGTGSFFRAMALFQQGKEEAAHDLFATATEQMTSLPEEGEDFSKDISANQIIVWLAHREADALINK